MELSLQYRSYGVVSKLWELTFAYSIILIEIQEPGNVPGKDTLRSPPAEHKTMKKATLFSITVTTVFNLLCACMGYAAFGDLAPGNLLIGFSFYDSYWLLDIANAAIVIHLVGAYQVYCQPLFAFIEKWSAKKWSKSDFVTAECDIPIPFFGVYQLNFFRLVWRTLFVILTIVLAAFMPFFNDVVGILGALGFWPSTVYFPLEIYMDDHVCGTADTEHDMPLISVAAAVGSMAGIVLDLKTYKPFKTTY